MLRYNLKWRTSPRSIGVLLDRLKYFYKVLYNKEEPHSYLYNYTIPNPYYPKRSKPKNIHPYRRRIVYDLLKNEINGGSQKCKANNKFVFEESENDFASGYQPMGDNADKESLVRQVATTAQQFGLMKSSNATLTQIGLKVCEDKFTSDDFICQLLKMYVITNKGKKGVFPFETFLVLMKKYRYLSLNEMTFIFGVLTRNDISKAIKAVGEFREEYHDRSIIPNRTDTKKVDTLIITVWNHYFHELSNYHLMPKGQARRRAKGTFNSINHDYPDAFKNSLMWTGIFTTHGYGQYKQIKVRKWTSYKFNALLKYNFQLSLKYLPNNTSSREDLTWFGGINVHLPWLNSQAIRNEMFYKLNYLKNLINSSQLKKYQMIYHNKMSSISLLENVNNQLDKLAIKSNWFKFIRESPMNKRIHENILNIYNEISSNTFDEGKPSLWLENITWKALTSIGSHINNDLHVIYYGSTDPDLKPKSYASGGYPDMAVTFDDTKFIVEVSLMTGVIQWEHEASSVITHIDTDIHNNKSKRQIYGIFIVNSINFRTWWQYFILNKESWLGKPIPVAPLTIRQFIEILKVIYTNKNFDIYKFNELISNIIFNARKVNNFHEWENNIPNIINDWKINIRS